MTDTYICEDCGYSYANGFRIFLNEKELLFLRPIAHLVCNNEKDTRSHYYENEMFKQLLNKLGYEVEVNYIMD